MKPAKKRWTSDGPLPNLEKLRISSGLHTKVVEFIWEIKNFKHFRTADKQFIIDHGFYVDVDAGEKGDIPTNWNIYLDIEKSNRKQWIAIYHELLSVHPEEIFSVLKISVRNKNGSGFFWNDELEMLHMNGNGSNSWGWGEFILKDAPEESLPLVNGSLIVEGKLTVLTKLETEEEKKFNWSDAERQAGIKLGKELEAFWRRKEGPDSVKLVTADGKEYYSNKHILSLRSPVFAAMFNSPMKEQESGSISIPDANGKAVVTMLRYLHDGKLIKSGFATGDHIADVAYLAEKYELPELHDFCDQMMVDKWDKLRAQESLDLANKFGLTLTKQAITSFIEKHVSNKN